MPGKPRGQDHLRILRMNINDEMLVRRHCVQADLVATKRSIALGKCRLRQRPRTAPLRHAACDPPGRGRQPRRPGRAEPFASLAIDHGETVIETSECARKVDRKDIAAEGATIARTEPKQRLAANRQRQSEVGQRGIAQAPAVITNRGAR